MRDRVRVLAVVLAAAAISSGSEAEPSAGLGRLPASVAAAIVECDGVQERCAVAGRQAAVCRERARSCLDRMEARIRDEVREQIARRDRAAVPASPALR